MCIIRDGGDDDDAEWEVGGLYTVSSGASGCSPPLSRDEGAPQPQIDNFIHYSTF